MELVAKAANNHIGCISVSYKGSCREANFLLLPMGNFENKKLKNICKIFQ
jgi:hypothetical protein